MIVVKTLKLKNFLSTGNVEQTVTFDNRDLTLILGENMDLGGNDAGSRNGTGKTTILQGLSYALFGVPINTIKRDNLINRTNGKSMSATVEFSVRDVQYRIVRSRKPNSLKFYINNSEQQVEDDDSQGDSRETQDAIERVLGMTPTMFQHIIGLNSYTTPFLSLKVGDQREVIEQLLGITLLSEKAEALKEMNRATRDGITAETLRIHGIEQANTRLGEQIGALRRRQTLWQNRREADLTALTAQHVELSQIDIQAELAAHTALRVWSEQHARWTNYRSACARADDWAAQHQVEVSQLEATVATWCDFDWASELASHTLLSDYVTLETAAEVRSDTITTITATIEREERSAVKLRGEIATLEQHRCYACDQPFHDVRQGQVLAAKVTALAECVATIEAARTQLATLEAAVVPLPPKPVTRWATQHEAIKQQTAHENAVLSLKNSRATVNPHSAQVTELQCENPGEAPRTHYTTEKQAIEHAGKLSSLLQQIEAKISEIDPYSEQITEMEQHGIQPVDYSHINELNRVLQHGEYLHELLTNKKSFVRKRIIEQNLAYLNSRLAHYLDRIGLPHRVVFQNDLSVEISEMGRDLDFDSLSRGERNRVILGLSFAFRDVFESLYSPVNILFIDELMDSGMDSAGIENGLALLKDMVRKRGKSVWLVSHKDELANRVNRILRVIKHGGFTEFQHDYM